MKLQLKNIIAVMAISTLMFSCTSDDDTPIVEGSTGKMEIEFDNSVNGDDLILNTNYLNSNGETLKISRFSYIVSNFVLISADGTEKVYPKNESYFIINEEEQLTTVHLVNVPSGDYVKMRFGLGVDQDRYGQGETAQQDFWDAAAANNLTWTWSTGYRFINFQGTFTSSLVSGEKEFMVHQGSNSATDNYREITLDFPTTAKVRTDASPAVHLIVDANKILDGEAKLKLSDYMNVANTSASIMGGQALITIAGNTTKMFVVDHVHANGH